MVPTSQYRALNDALDTVSVNAQALAAADTALGALSSAQEQFSSYSIKWERRQWASDLSDARADVARYRSGFIGMPGSPVDAEGWDDLRHAIDRAYNVMWNIADVAGTETEWQAFGDYVSSVTLGTIQALPGVIKSAVHFTSDTATDLVGGVAAGLLPLWPIVAVAAVLAAGVGFLALGAKRRGLL